MVFQPWDGFLDGGIDVGSVGSGLRLGPNPQRLDAVGCFFCRGEVHTPTAI